MGSWEPNNMIMVVIYYSPPVSYLAQREEGGLVLPEERGGEPLRPLYCWFSVSLFMR